LNRRHFLALAGGGGVGLLVPSCLPEADSSSKVPTALTPRYSISLAEWSLHRALRAGELTHQGFPGRAHELGIEAVEYVNSFFDDKGNQSSHLDELELRCSDLGVRSLLIMCDGEGRLGDPDKQKRTQAVRNHLRWLEAAQRLGCHSIRVNAAGSGSREEQGRLAADGLRALCETAVPFGQSVIVENHGGLSSDGNWLAGVIRAVDHPAAGTLPDFGNFNLGGGKSYDRYKGVRELMPFAKAVSAKSHEFDADGNEVRTDYSRMLDIVCDSGYSGWIGIEYEGNGMSEEEGIRATRTLLEKHRFKTPA